MTTDDRHDVGAIIDSAMVIVRRYISKEPEKVVAIEENNENWSVVVEVLERKAVPDTQDILGRYEIKLTGDGELLGWKQKMIRKRSNPLAQEDA
jgi:hypothetical protein